MLRSRLAGRVWLVSGVHWTFLNNGNVQEATVVREWPDRSSGTRPIQDRIRCVSTSPLAAQKKAPVRSARLSRRRSQRPDNIGTQLPRRVAGLEVVQGQRRVDFDPTRRTTVKGCRTAAWKIQRFCQPGHGETDHVSHFTGCRSNARPLLMGRCATRQARRTDAQRGAHRLLRQRATRHASPPR